MNHMKIAYFHRGEFIEYQALKCTHIWELKLTNFSLSSKINESYLPNSLFLMTGLELC